MAINVRYLASLRDTLGRDSDTVDCAGTSTVSDVWRAANPDHEMPAKLLVAINQEHASLSAGVKDGDEVAFFPPVTGG